MPNYTTLDTLEAVERLRAGQVIAYPTEAVYGLGCDPRNESAVRHILSIKDREASMGLVLIGSHFDQFSSWVEPVGRELLDNAMRTWPGPVTWLFPRADGVPDFVAGRHATVAIRVTDHQASRALCEAFGSPLVSTSANPSTAEPARSAAEVDDYFGDQIAGILEGHLGDGDKPSEIRDLLSGNILRQG